MVGSDQAGQSQEPGRCVEAKGNGRAQTGHLGQGQRRMPGAGGQPWRVRDRSGACCFTQL